MSRPRLLDLFSGAGGAAEGYHRAGFDVVGVDIKPQPRYPFEFVQADALEVLRALADGGTSGGYRLADFAAIHTSPVCLTFARVTDWRGSRAIYPDTLTPALEILGRVSTPWVVENVTEAPLRADILLCGSQFGLRVQRHRKFQTGNWFTFDLMPPCCHRDLLPFEHKGERAYADAMGCDWMSNREARQAIPPAYTEYIGAALLEAIRERAA